VGFAFFNIKVRKNMEYAVGCQKQVFGLLHQKEFDLLKRCFPDKSKISNTL
jgi:hypothetical protein